MRKYWLLFSQAVTVGLAALFIVTTLKPDWRVGGLLAPAGNLWPQPTLTAAPSRCRAAPTRRGRGRSPR